MKEYSFSMRIKGTRDKTTRIDSKNDLKNFLQPHFNRTNLIYDLEISMYKETGQVFWTTPASIDHNFAKWNQEKMNLSDLWDYFQMYLNIRVEEFYENIYTFPDEKLGYCNHKGPQSFF